MKKSSYQNILNEKLVTCPICLNLMRDSVIDECGHSFCEECIYKSYYNKKICPCTNLKISDTFIPNLTVRKIVQELKMVCDCCDQEIFKLD